MHVNLPPTVDPQAFAEWCEAFRINATLIVVRSAGEVIGYTARTDDPDAVTAIELKWTTRENAQPVKEAKLKRLRPFREHLLDREQPKP